MSVGEVYLADDFVSIAEVFRFVNDFFQKFLKKYKMEKMERKTAKNAIKRHKYRRKMRISEKRIDNVRHW